MQKIDKALKYGANPRQITAAQFNLLKKHLEQLGDLSGIIYCRKNKAYTGGNMRAEVMDGCKVEIVEEFKKPTKQKTVARGFVHWQGEKFAYREVAFTEKEFKQACIVANSNGGTWDWDVLSGGAWQDEPLIEWGLDLPEDWLEPKGGVEEDESAVAEMVDKAAALQKKWKVKPGSLYTIGPHRLLCGDSTRRGEVARLMEGENAGTVLTDPIYGQAQEGVTNDQPEGFEGTIRGAVAALPVENAAVVAFASPRTFTVWLDAVRDAGHKFERMLWMYKAAQCTFPWRGWILTSESILISSKGEAAWQDVHPYSHDCYYLPEVSGELDESIGWHGSVKPLKVVADLLVRISAQGDIVFDGFSGSGTTMAACEEHGRLARCMDIDPLNCAVTLERMSRLGLSPELVK